MPTPQWRPADEPRGGIRGVPLRGERLVATAATHRHRFHTAADSADAAAATSENHHRRSRAHDCDHSSLRRHSAASRKPGDGQVCAVPCSPPRGLERGVCARRAGRLPGAERSSRRGGLYVIRQDIPARFGVVRAVRLCGEFDVLRGPRFVEGAVAEQGEQDTDALAGEAEEGLGVGLPRARCLS